MDSKDIDEIIVPDTCVNADGGTSGWYSVSRSTDGTYTVKSGTTLLGDTFTFSHTLHSFGDDTKERIESDIATSLLTMDRILRYNVSVVDDGTEKYVYFNYEDYAEAIKEYELCRLMPSPSRLCLRSPFNLMCPSSLVEFADKMLRVTSEIYSILFARPLTMYTVRTYDGGFFIRYLSAKDIRVDKNFLYFEGNVTSSDYMVRCDDVKQVNRVVLDDDTLDAIVKATERK